MKEFVIFYKFPPNQNCLSTSLLVPYFQCLIVIYELLCFITEDQFIFSAVFNLIFLEINLKRSMTEDTTLFDHNPFIKR